MQMNVTVFKDGFPTQTPG